MSARAACRARVRGRSLAIAAAVLALFACVAPSMAAAAPEVATGGSARAGVARPTGTLLPGLGGVVSAVTGRLEPRQVGLVGDDVAAVVSDGRGGWYVGGFFTVGGRWHNLVHIRRDGHLDRRFHPEPDMGVDALARRGRTLYVGGFFGRIGGRRRAALAAIRTDSGKATSWAPAVARYPLVYALALSGRTVYAGGYDLTAFDARTGSQRPTPVVGGGGTGVGVMALAVDGGALYLGGRFSQVAGQERDAIAAIDLASGELLPFAPKIACCADEPPVEGPIPPTPGPFPPEPPSFRRPDRPYVAALAVTGGKLVVGGDFDTIDGQPRRFIAGLDPPTGALTAFAPSVDGAVHALATRGNTVYVGSAFGLGNAQGRYASAFDSTTGAPFPWRPRPRGPIEAVAVSNGRAYIGGEIAACGPSFGYLACSVVTGHQQPGSALR
jgi:hypothetical protein